MEHVDVVIVGAGLSGVGAAVHLQERRPGSSYVVLESRGAIGGTWDLFRYPGIRSDSDMYTLGYSFKPWAHETAIADGETILGYIRETARERGVEKHIRFGTKVERAEWDSASATWTVHATRDGEPVTLTCSFLYACTGYYDYEAGYTPAFPGIERFRGRVVHPQFWPEDLDHRGQRVVVVGSGATAVTLVPALAKDAAHVTMLQRSPAYVISLPQRDPLAALLRRFLPARASYPVLRWKNVLMQMASYQFSRRRPERMRAFIRRDQVRRLPEGYAVDTHFRPSYDPWDQRLCIVPDGDLFRAIRKGTASVATDTIDTFTEDGVRLASGEELAADVVVTATGLNLLPAGGMTLSVDGADVKLSETVTYKGMMLSGVPNFALTVGYTNASWTLKADLVAGYVCRLLDHLDEHGFTTATPVPPPPGDDTVPLIDLRSGYVLRSVADMPRQGARPPWRLHQSYPRDLRLMRRRPVDDEGMRFSGSRARARVAAR